MIEVRDLRKSFDGFYALDGLDLHAPQGCIYGLVGPNGSGKTTLIRHLTGILRQDGGSVCIGGQEVYENNAVKGRVASIPDELFFFTSASVRDMRIFYKSIYPDFDDARYQKLSDAFDIKERRSVRTLSKGMQKQAAFWLAMSRKPDVLILDEPVDGLDPVMRRQIWSIVAGDVSERGMTVLVSSHNLRELEDICDHVGIIDHGKLLLERPLSELCDSIVKVQAVFEQPDALEHLSVVHKNENGRLVTAIIRGEREKIERALQELSPVYCDILPLTLEEIFIYELGGEHYGVKDIVL